MCNRWISVSDMNVQEILAIIGSFPSEKVNDPIINCGLIWLAQTFVSPGEG